MATSGVKLVQLGKPHRTLGLFGNAAPHGRPRKGPVVTPEQRLRESETYLPGSDEPVVHVFGQRREPILMHGRWRDAKSGKGFAQAKMEEMASFFSDKQVCRVTWDDLLDFHGLLTRFTPKIESKGEVEWELEIKVLRNLLDLQDTPAVQIKGPKDITNQILASLKLKEQVPFVPATLRGSVVDTLSGLVSIVNSASAFLVDAANDFDAFATGSITALRRFRAGLGQLRVAVNTLRGTYDNMVVMVALESESADESQPFWDLKSAWSASSLESLRLIAQAEREAAKAEQGRLLALHEAKLGETWESMARRWYAGSEERAGEIRDANGVDAGTEPIPGVIYRIPR